MGFIDEFKQFAVKGNALDMAVGLIIGAAFNKIVTSLVNDVIMPPLGFLIGGTDFKHLEIVLKPEVKDAAGAVTTPAAVIRYGLFVNNVIDFMIVSFTIFVMLKFINRLMEARLNLPVQLPTQLPGIPLPGLPIPGLRKGETPKE